MYNNLSREKRENYIDADKRAVDPRYWIHQIGMVFKSFPKIQFTIYQDD